MNGADRPRPSGHHSTVPPPLAAGTAQTEHDPHAGKLRPEDPAFRRVSLALFAAAISMYASVYAPQPLLPLLSRELGIAPAVASLALSATTISLAVAMLVAGALTDGVGRKPIMAVALTLIGIIGVAVGFAPDFGSLLLLRALEGLVIAALPAATMAYLAEEIHPRHLGMAMGLYISGNSVGGLAGRIVSGTLADVVGWRVALGAIGVLSLLSAIWFIRTLPPSRHFRPRPFRLGSLFGSLGRCLGDPGLRLLYACSFLLVGSLVSLYNYVGFELMSPPYGLSATLVSWIFVVYLVGTLSSTLMGRLADRYGRGVIRASVAIMLVGAVATLAPSLPLKLLGLVLFTFGFFGGHSIASGWVGARAGRDVAPASGLYLFFFYLGSSTVGSGGGLVYAGFGWSGLIALIAAFLSVALVATTVLRRMEGQT